MRAAIITAAAGMALLLGACNELSPSGAKKKEHKLGGEYGTVIDKNTAMKISDATIVTVISADGKGSGSFSSDAYKASLYPLVQKSCTPCHKDNRYPFASDAIFQASEAAQQWVNLDKPEESRMVLNIKEGHSGVSPDLAPSFIEAIGKLK